MMKRIVPLRCLAITLMVILHFSNCPAEKQNIQRIYWKDLAEDSTLSMDARIEALEKLIGEKGSDRAQKLEYKIELLKSSLRFREAAQTYGELWKYASEFSDRKKLEILHQWSKCLYASGCYSGAVHKSLELLSIDKPDSLKIFDGNAFLTLAFLKMELGDPNRGNYELHQADSILNKFGKSSRLSDVTELRCALLRSKASLLTSEKKYKEALDLIDKVREIDPNPLTQANIDGYMGDIYSLAGEFDIAERYYKKVMSSKLRYYNKQVSLCNYMSMLNDCGRYDASLSLYDSMKDQFPSYHGEMLTVNLLGNRAVANAGLGNYKEAYELMLKSRSMQDSIFRDYMISEQLSIFELENKIKGQKRIAKENKGLWIAIYISIAIAIILVCAGLILNRALAKQKGKVKDAENSLAEIEGKYGRIVNERNERIDSQDRELMTYTLQLAQVDELINDILNLTGKTKMSSAEKLSIIRNNILNLDLQKNIWEIFKSYFEHTHPGFFKKLYEIHPTLSANEARMCAYIMLNLSTKEIASITNRSARTVETTKYRLHKKLGLSDEPTISYLHRLVGTQPSVL